MVKKKIVTSLVKAKKPKAGNMSNLSNIQVGKINMKGGKSQPGNIGKDRYTPHKKKPQPQSEGTWEGTYKDAFKASGKTTMFSKFKSKAKAGYKTAKKDLGKFGKTKTGKVLGKGIAYGATADVGYQIGKARHQDVQTLKIVKKS